MKLIRFGPVGDERAGILDADGARRDTSTFGEDWDEEFFASDGLSRLTEWLAQHHAALPRVADDVRWASCVARPSKIVCIGLNYHDHAKETGGKVPVEPILFAKSTSSLVGPFDDLWLPPGSTKTDWEVELAVVIGRRTLLVTEADAMSHVAGYALHNDYSERAFQLERGGQWIHRLLELSRYSAPLAQLGKLRSAGVTDLRYGNVLDAHWEGRDRFAHEGDPRVNTLKQIMA